MKADVQITLEDDEVFGVLRRLHTVLRKRENPNAEPLVESIPEEEGEEQETAYEEWSKPPPNQRNCTLCGVELIRGENITTKRIDKRDHVCNSCNSKYKKRSEVEQRHCFRCGISLNESNVGSKFHCICIGCKGLDKKSAGHVTLTADQRTQWARERREIVGETITQPGAFQGALITEHIRGTHYKVQLPSGDVIDAKHKKQKTLGGDELGAGWSKWEKRS